MREFEYIRQYYGVPACYGRRVKVGGRLGIIVADRGCYIGVNFDDTKPTCILPCHPTSHVEYMDIGIPRKLTRSQKRYQKYLEVADCYPDGFGQFLKDKVIQEI